MMMNPHYNPYQELHHSPHSPPLDGYHPGPQTILNNGHLPPQGQNDSQRVLNGDNEGSPGYSNNSGMCGMQNSGAKICAGCGGKILERFLLYALDRYWHHTCLKCSCCGTMLADVGSSCFTKGGMILCKSDYIRLFGSAGACAACGQTIPPNELVMRAGPSSPHPAHPHQPPNTGHYTYHPKCFVCSKCQTMLMPGDRYAFVHGALFCEQDCQKLLKGPGSGVGGAQTGPVRKGKVGRPRRSRD